MARDRLASIRGLIYGAPAFEQWSAASLFTLSAATVIFIAALLRVAREVVKRIDYIVMS